MIEKIIDLCLKNKLMVLLAVVILVIGGIFSAARLPLDAVPDITNNQVQIVSTAPTLAPQEVEQLITYPIEAAMTNLPKVLEVRSLSRYGLSVITIIFEDDLPLMLARQYVQEKLSIVKENLQGISDTEMMPITTGLGEIYQYVLTVDEEFAHLYNPTQLRTIQDWIVKRQLNGTKGIVEISSFGGYLKEYEIAVNPNLLKINNLDLLQVSQVLKSSNQNSGGSYIEDGAYAFYIRTKARLYDQQSIENVLVSSNNGVPIRVKDIAQVKIGSAKRYGAMTMDGKGEVVGGITLMLKGESSWQTLQEVKVRIALIEKTLPEGVHIYPYLDRSKLIDKTIKTVESNLLEGGLIVVFVLLLLLGKWRAGLIVASVIPLSLLFALIMMNIFGISANLMSLGAIDFGIVIDGAVIVVESLLHTLHLGFLGKRLSATQMDEVVASSTSKIYRSAAFGVLIILVVFLPILTLEGIEGKTFRPMVQTLGFALVGAMLLSISYVPVVAALFLRNNDTHKVNFSDKIMNFLQNQYGKVLEKSLDRSKTVLAGSVLMFALAFVIFSRLGAEFIPTLEEGDIAMQQSLKSGSSLQESIRTSTMVEKILLENFSEIDHVVSKIGTAEVPTDPMSIENADIMIILKDKQHWKNATTREELIALMKEKLELITWATFEFSQPIQLRFNELMTGVKTDLSIKIFGEDLELLHQLAQELAPILSQIQGAADVKVDQTEGLKELSVTYYPENLAQYGIKVQDANQVIRTAYAGEKVGEIFEQERRFDWVLRLDTAYRKKLDLNLLQIRNEAGVNVNFQQIAQITLLESPMLISRESAKRFINIGVNVRDRDVASLVAEIQSQLAQKFKLPAGYQISYGGQFENLENAQKRLAVAVPVALGLILLCLYLAFASWKDSFIIFVAVPLSAVGGIWALYLRQMPFSISSGIGFIALFGVAVLNGLVLVNAIKEKAHSQNTDFRQLVKEACMERLRPVLMTALVAALGFLPMAISTGNGAEVQRPLATVVIGGLISASVLTLVLLPNIYYWLLKNKKISLIFPLLFAFLPHQAQDFEQIYSHALQKHPSLQRVALAKKSESLNRKALVQWQDAEANYLGGQVNYQNFDQQLEWRQDISPLFRFRERQAQNQLINKQLGFLDAQEKLAAARLRFELQNAHNDFLFWKAKKALARQILDIYEDLAPKINLQNELGELDKIEAELFNTEKMRFASRWAYATQQQILAESKLKQLAFLPQTYQFSEQTLEKIALPTAVFDSLKSLFLKNYQLQSQVLGQQAHLLRLKAKQVQIRLNYFAQSLEQVFWFQAAGLTLQLPLDRRWAKIRSQQLQIQQQEIAQQASFEQQQFQHQVLALQESIDILGQSLQNYEQKSLVSQNTILEKSKTQYQNAEIDFLRFSQIQERLLQQKDAHLDQLKTYNEQIIQLQFLTQNYE